MPTPSPEPTSSNPPAPSDPTPAPITYTVADGDTLSALASRFATTVEAIRLTNELTSDLILIDQTLLLPAPVDPDAQPEASCIPTLGAATGAAAAGATSEMLPPVVVETPYHFSLLTGDLAIAYPDVVTTEHFDLHLTPNTLPAADPQAVVDLISHALAHHEQLLGVTLKDGFDVYVAGTLFAPPDQDLRGRSFSPDRRYFFLFDGSGDDTDQQYIAAHELTHLFAWNTLGAPSSVMLSEGLAVYAGMDLIAGSDHLPIDQFCAAYYQAGRLPHVAQELSYLGHIRDLKNYYAAGCFVRFLFAHYGAVRFGQLYPTGHYLAVYGKTLLDLEAEWVTEVAAHPAITAFAPADLVWAVDTVSDAYVHLLAGFDGSPAALADYQALDTIRIALLEGRLDAVKQGFSPSAP